MESDPRQGPTLVGGPLLSPDPPERGSRISLLIYHGSGTRVVSLAEGESLVVGRDPAADVSLNDQALSRRHARFSVLDGEVWVEDLGSTNGTFVNGEAITRERLRVGDEARLGGVVASIHVLASPDQRHHGLDSHDQFLFLLAHELARGRCFGRPVALVMLQANGIREAVESVRPHLRPADRVALYSGDLIEIVLPETSADSARRFAKRVHDSLRTAGLTASIAIAPFPEAGTSTDALVEACREALRSSDLDAPIAVASNEPRSWDPPREGGVQGLIVRSPAMQEILETIDRLTNSLIPVLIVGETGTGKEVVARLLHQSGPRKARRMVSINCGAIPATLVESVLFGHEKGSFTGATQSSKGLFEEADGGTLLLDEVGELSPSAQAALLRVLETKELSRVGSNRLIAVDVRVIAATHRDLQAMCEAGRFRLDLLYRLNTMTLRVPPLRERPEEIAPLAEMFLRAANQASGRRISGIDARAMQVLHSYSWPGNVRELRNVVERAVLIARTDRITVQDLPQALCNTLELEDKPRPAPAQVATGAQGPWPSAARPEASACHAPAGVSGPLDFRTQMEQHAALIIQMALRQANWNRARASQILNLPLRTLSHKMKQLGLAGTGRGLDGSD